MAPATLSRRKRAAPMDDDDDSPPRRQRLRSPDEEEEDEEDEAFGMEGNDGSREQMVKKLVRYALACEYARMPITRKGISEIAFGKQRTSFKAVFDAAQDQLMKKFGMEMVPLASKEKVTLKDRLKEAGKGVKGSKASTSYVLTTTLPDVYRTPAIIPPAKIGSDWEEATYTGLCTAVIAIISMSTEHTISDARLLSLLEKLNAEEYMLLDKTDEVLKRMARDGYIYKITDRDSEGEKISWMVGPRGKAQVGNSGVLGLVTEVYGTRAPRDLKNRIYQSLGMQMGRAGGAEPAEEIERPEGRKVPRARKPAGRGQRSEAGDEDDEEEEEDVDV